MLEKLKSYFHEHEFVPIRMLDDGFVLMRCKCGQKATDIPLAGTRQMLLEEERLAEGEKSILEENLYMG